MVICHIENYSKRTFLEFICFICCDVKKNQSYYLVSCIVGFNNRNACRNIIAKKSLVSVSVFSDNDSCDMDNCCHNETQVYQLKEDFSIPANPTIPDLSELDLWGNDLFTVELLK